ncbi:hypothetical protein WDW37_11710 [Bdellovibrionota bacterium FG-1]
MLKKKSEAGTSSTHHEIVHADLEYPRVQNELAELILAQLLKVRACIEKINKMTWAQVLATSSMTQKRGLHWEVLNQKTASGDVIASIRVSDKFRARVTREGVYMQFISLHPDHDSAYKESGGENV